MEKIFALIKNNIVVNVIVCNDENFLNVLKSDGVHEVSVRVDGCPFRPSIGWQYEVFEDIVKFTSPDNSMYVRVQNNELIEIVQN